MFSARKEYTEGRDQRKRLALPASQLKMTRDVADGARAVAQPNVQRGKKKTTESGETKKGAGLRFLEGHHPSH